LETGADPEAFKLYINDTGLLASMMSEDVAHAILTGDVRTNKGSVIENAVASALESKGHRLYYFSSKNFEIDFITAMRGAVAAIEVKSGNNRRSKSLDSMKDKYGTKRRMKFEITDIAVTEDGVEHYPLFCCQFLDSLYEPYGTVSGMPDAGQANDLLKKAFREESAWEGPFQGLDSFFLERQKASYQGGPSTYGISMHPLS
jgi:hypothetical protein